MWWNYTTYLKKRRVTSDFALSAAVECDLINEVFSFDV
jgi:hypothetical protein